MPTGYHSYIRSTCARRFGYPQDTTGILRMPRYPQDASGILRIWYPQDTAVSSGYGIPRIPRYPQDTVS